MIEEFETVKDRKQKMLPQSRKAQKEFIRDLLASNQEQFEKLFAELAEHDPKRWLELYVDLTKHTVPKQTSVNVNVGINKDYRDLQMLASTKLDGGRAIGLHRMEQIEDADYEEIKGLGENTEDRQ